MEKQKRHFNFYGYLWPLSQEDYNRNVIYWMYEDEDEDGTIIVRNTVNGELRYVEGSELEMSIDEQIKVMCDLIALWQTEHGQDQTYYDAIAIRCDLIAKSPVPVHHYRNGFLDLIYCGGCSAIVTKGDKFCNQCGRRLTDND